MNGRKAIYDYIKEALDDQGNLPEDFSLPEENEKSEENMNGLKFAPGAMDGIILYHFGPSSDKDNEERILLKEAIETAANGSEEEAFDKIEEYAKKAHAISDMDVLVNHIIKHQSVYAPDKIFKFACRLITMGTRVEAVKIGMGILELFRTNEMPKVKDMIRMLSQYDEFALFGCFLILSGWDNRDEELLEIAKKNHGWGRIHAVARIAPASEEIKEWLLIHGVHNGILSNYSAMACFHKADVRNLLEQSLTAEQLEGCTDIIEALMGEQPMSGISELDDGEEILLKYLAILDHTNDITDRQKEVVEKIREYGMEYFEADSKLNQYFKGEI